MTNPARPAVFFDRDDTLIHCSDVTPDGDLGDPALVQLRPGALECCRALAAAGFVLAVVSNQGGVARGKYPETAVEACNRRAGELLHDHLGRSLISAFRFCPYHPRGTVPEYTREHPWRKPQPGMILDLASVLGLDLDASWAVGDMDRDCQAGRSAGCRTILVPSGLPEKRSNTPPPPGTPAEGFIDYTAPDLPAAAAIILRESRL
ncbi:MAG: HAD-IIIA family hydrolase [Phycisphaerales bacterium]|nr:HAD-IIIA family hydrolase [Phycisphaerales bacterium]